MVRDREIETVSGQEAVEKVSRAWRKFRAGEPPIEQVNVILGEEGSSPAEWEDGVVTVAEEMNKGRYGTSSLEIELFEQMDEAFEETIEKEVEVQRDILEDRYGFLDDFDLHYEGVQVAELETAEAHHGREVKKWGQVNNGSNFIVVDYEYLPLIDPLEDKVDGAAERLVRHEAVHALQTALDNGFWRLWQETGSRDIRRATTEGMARYEQYKGSDIERDAEKAARNPWKIPEFWRKNVASEGASPTDPYNYGEMAAYFLEERAKEDFCDRVVREHEEPYPAVKISNLDDYAETEVRKTLIENPEKEDLDRELSEASGKVGVDWYGKHIEKQKERLTEDGELDYQLFERWAPYERRGLEKVLEKPIEQRNELTDLTKWYQASAADAIYREFSEIELQEGEKLRETIEQFEESLGNIEHPVNRSPVAA